MGDQAPATPSHGRIKVLAGDIDDITNHLVLDGNMSRVELKNYVEKQLERLEIQLLDSLLGVSALIHEFMPHADTQLPAKCTLDSIEEQLITIKPLLLLVMDRRGFGDFLYYVGGLRSLYICLLEACAAIKRIIHFHKGKLKPFKRTPTLSNVLYNASLWMKGQTDQEETVQANTTKRDGLFSSGASYVSLQAPNESQLRMKKVYGELLKKQLESSQMILQHVVERLELLLAFWSPDPSIDKKYVFTPFMKMQDVYKGISDLNPGDILGKHNFGFTYVRSLVEYATKLKAVYCAVHESSTWKEQKWMAGPVFYSAAAHYFLSPDIAGIYYEKVRAQLDLSTQREVWNLMEDPVIEYFATALGFNPPKLDLKVETDLLLESSIVPLTINQLEGDASLYSSTQDKKTLLIKCSYFFSREVTVDGSLYPSVEQETEHNTTLGNFSLSSLRGILTINPHQKEDIDPSVKRQSSFKQLNKKLSAFSMTSRRYNSLTSLPMKPEEEQDISSMYQDKKSKFQKRRDNFLDTDVTTFDDLETESLEYQNDSKEKEKQVEPPVGWLFDLGQSFDDSFADDNQDVAYNKEEAKEEQKRLTEYSPVIIMHVHGGGWISQSPRTHVAYLRTWAEKTNIPILSVDYGLSPENQFPGALQECMATYKWLLNPENAQKLGLPALDAPPRIILTGDSAGGNLCCALTIQIIREKLQRPIGILLSYPVVQPIPSASISRMVFANDPVLHFQSMGIVLSSYLGARSDIAFTEPLVSPGLMSDDILCKFPPTTLMVGDVDPIIDDSVHFFTRLRNVGVSTSLHIYRHLPHGYLNLPSQLPNAPKAIHDAADIFTSMIRNDDRRNGFTVL